MGDEIKPNSPIRSLVIPAFIDADYVHLNYDQEVRLWGKIIRIMHPVLRPEQQVINKTEKTMRELNGGNAVKYGTQQLKKPGIINSLRAISLTAEGNLDFENPTFSRGFEPGPIFYYATSFVGNANDIRKFRWSDGGQVRVYRFVRCNRTGNIVEVGFEPILEGKGNNNDVKPSFKIEDLRLLKGAFGIRNKQDA